MPTASRYGQTGGSSGMTVSEKSVEKANQILASWQGHAQHGNSENFIKYLLNRFNYLKIANGILVIDVDKL